MTSLHSSIVNISLPAIARAFDASVGGKVEWVIIAYLVVAAGLLLSVGRLADVFGSAPLWIAGLVVFSVGSALSGAAPTLELLIAARAFQGIGGALIVASSLVILCDAFPVAERGRALGSIAVASAISASVGPVLGGAISGQLGWRWIFFLSVPISLGAALASHRVLPRNGVRSRASFDLRGALLFGVGVVGMTLLPSIGPQWGWTSPQLAATVGIVVVAFIGAGLVERSVAVPLLDLAFFRNRGFVAAMLRLILSRLALIAVSFLLPFYFEELRGFSPQWSGLLLTPLPLSIMIVGPIGGYLVDHFSSRRLEALSLAVVALSLFALAHLGTSSSMQVIAVWLIAVGIGQGVFAVSNSKAILDAAPAPEQGQASGLLSTGQVVGGSLGIAVASAIFAGFGSGAAAALLGHQDAALSPGHLAAAQAAFLAGFRVAFLVCAAFALLGVLAALLEGAFPAPAAKAPTRSQGVVGPLSAPSQTNRP
ncbi:MAG TPA: DHA2 family efflux MFS transporter permease subunit [Thermomicrobiales bacterium]|nr:DHA2 family efflux MFS transporter permease subunit [Thermomicrobiales bacterium]